MIHTLTNFLLYLRTFIPVLTQLIVLSTEITCLGEVDRKDYKSISTQMMQPKTKIEDVESNSMIQLSPFYDPKFSFNETALLEIS